MTTDPTRDPRIAAGSTAIVPNRLKERLEAGELSLALLLRFARTPDIALAAQTCGFDAVYIDMEHSSVTEPEAAQISVTSAMVGVTPLVRVPTPDPALLARVLDAGAQGVVIPHVQSAAEAQQVVEAISFPPSGNRSVSGSWPQFRHAPLTADMPDLLAHQTLTILMIESAEGVENAAAIAAVQGVDVLHIGTSDLAQDLGVDKHAPRFDDAVKQVIEACRAEGKVAGLGGLSDHPDLVDRFVEAGATLVTVGSEWKLMMAAATDAAERLRGGPAGGTR